MAVLSIFININNIMLAPANVSEWEFIVIKFVWNTVGAVTIQLLMYKICVLAHEDGLLHINGKTNNNIDNNARNNKKNRAQSTVQKNGTFELGGELRHLFGGASVKYTTIPSPQLQKLFQVPREKNAEIVDEIALRRLFRKPPSRRMKMVMRLFGKLRR